MRNLGTGMLILTMAALPAKAQEPWDSSFHLLAGTVSGANEHGVGQNRSIGLSIQGTYPLLLKGFVVVDAGYRYLPTTTRVEASGATVENKADGYFGGCYYRHELFAEGFYLQAGLRYTQMKPMQTTRNGSQSITHDKTPKVATTAVVGGAGYRFTEKLSLDVTFSSLNLQNLEGIQKRSATVECSLGIHLGK